VRKSFVGGGFKRFKSKESRALVLDQIRVATEPLMTVMMCTVIMAGRRIEDAKELRTSIRCTLTGTLRRLEQRGLVKDVGRAENGLSAFRQFA
jgi:5-carboxymethyl-2-hydroxymuconate isomerase